MLLLTKRKVKIIYQTSRIQTSVINVDGVLLMIIKTQKSRKGREQVGTMTLNCKLLLLCHSGHIQSL